MTPEGDSRCIVDIDGVASGPRAIHGDSRLQALCLAMRFAGHLLHGPPLCAPPPAATDGDDT